MFSVVLPAPLAPSTATIAPGRHAQVHAAQHGGEAIAGFEAAYLKHRPHPAGASRRHGRDRPRPPPVSRTTSAGDPEQMMRPWASTCTVSHRFITACITCSIISTVTPSSRMARTIGHDVADLGRVEAGQHLIEQQQLRARGERARDLQPLAPGDGQRRGRLVELIREPDPQRNLLRRLQRRCAPGLAQEGTDGDVLAHRQPGEGLHDLEGPREAHPRQVVRAPAGDVLALRASPSPMSASRSPRSPRTASSCPRRSGRSAR